MPALVATRFNPDMRATYDRLRAAGKPPKLALTAVMRKLLVLANALLKANRPWAPKPLDQDGYLQEPKSGFCSLYPVAELPVAGASPGVANERTNAAGWLTSLITKLFITIAAL
jgi:hypothetical protein